MTPVALSPDFMKGLNDSLKRLNSSVNLFSSLPFKPSGGALTIVWTVR